MLSAFGRAIREQGEELEISQKKLNNYFLFNSEEEGDLHYKLLLTQSDKHTLIRLFEEKELPDPTSKRVIENYEFFEKKIRESGIDLMTL